MAPPQPPPGVTMAAVAVAAAQEPARAFERTLRLSLQSSPSPSASSSSVLSALLADATLLRDAQTLFQQIVPRTSPLSGASLSSSLSSQGRVGVRSTPPSPFSAFVRVNQREGGIDAGDKLSALVAVVATGVTHELQQEKRAEQAAAGNDNSDTAAAVGNGDGDGSGDAEMHATGKRKRQDDSESEDAIASSPPTWDLVALLTDANVSLSAFLRHFTSLFDRLLLDPELLGVATQLKEEFTIATVLFEKYRVLWKRLVPPVTSGHVHEPRPTAHAHTQAQARRGADEEGEREREPELQQRTPPRRKMSDSLFQQLVSVDRHQLLHDAGWLLFLIAKRRLSAQYTGLGQLYYLLLAVLHLVLSNLSAPSVEAEVAAALSALGGGPATSSSPSPSSSAGNGDDAGNGSNNQKILDVLCSNPKVDQHEVVRATAHLDEILLQMQAEQGFLLTQDAATTTAAAGAGGADSARSYASAVLSSSVVSENVSRLSAYYKSEYLDGCGKLDERFYLDAAAHQVIMGPKPLSLSSSHPPLGSSGTNSALSSPMPTKRPARADRLIPLNPFSSPVRQPMTPQRREGNAAAMRGSSTPLNSHVSGTPGPPPSPYTLQAWQFQGSSPPPSTSLSSSRAMHTPNTRAFLQTATNHQASPFVAQTPVTAAVETSNWVRDTLASASGFMTPSLAVFFKECTNDPTDHIVRILQELSQKLMTARRRSVGLLPTQPSLDENENMAQLPLCEYSEVDGSLQKTKNLAIALFYRVLEALLISERDRLRTTNFSSLLNNETFVSSLYACSLEVVLKAHSLITLSFPFLLDFIGVNAFDFGKIIESFVKHVPKLPNVLKRHMRDLEQTILDSLAWRSDSGLYVVLAGDAKPSESSLLASLTNGTPATASASSTRTSVLQLFFRKVLSLAASRIFRLGTLLELDAKYLNQVWTAIKECVSTHHSLLRDRHLDQVILCSLYGVCKLNQVSPEVTFKRVLDAYKKMQSLQQQQHSGAVSGSSAPIHSLARDSAEVIRNIKLDDDSRGDIIKFYNRCYIPTMKVFMLQFQVVEKQMAAADAVVASATGANAGASQAPPGFTPRREGSVVASSTSDTEIVAEAAADAVDKVMKSYGLSSGPGTPARRSGGGVFASPRMIGSPISSLQLFTTTEVQSLPVSVHQTSPKRVLASNIYMSPLQQARLHHRSHLTPRSHALYAFGESPSRDLALINRAVNTSTTRTRVVVPPPLVLTESHEDEEEEETSESNSNSAASTPTNSAAAKRRRTG